MWGKHWGGWRWGEESILPGIVKGDKSGKLPAFRNFAKQPSVGR